MKPVDYFVEITRAVTDTYRIHGTADESRESLVRRIRDGEGELLPQARKEGEMNWSSAVLRSLEDMVSGGLAQPKRVRAKRT